MTVKELKDELSKFDDNLNIKFISGYQTVSNLDVWFEEEKTWSENGNYLNKHLIMHGDY